MTFSLSAIIEVKQRVVFKLIDNKIVEVEDVERILKRYQQNEARIRCYDYLFEDLGKLATNSTIQIETKIKFYIRNKRKQILRIEEQNKKISSLIQRIDKVEEIQVLYMYYVKGMHRDKIAEAICYDEAYTSQIKMKALRHLSERIQVEELEELLQII